MNRKIQLTEGKVSFSLLEKKAKKRGVDVRDLIYSLIADENEKISNDYRDEGL
tara:strand:- start:124 stop:282 length:159 start_codon:yes stop_codon:yes gene_type:complete